MINRKLINPMVQQSFVLGRFVATYLKGTSGQHHVVRYPVAYARTRADHRAMVVKGGLRLVEAPVGVGPYPDRDLGSTTDDLHDVTVPGVYIRECKGDTLLVCLTRNGRSFNYANVRAAAGETFKVPLGGVFLTGDCALTIDGGPYGFPDLKGQYRPIHAVTKPLTIATVSPVYGLIGWVE